MRFFAVGPGIAGTVAFQTLILLAKSIKSLIYFTQLLFVSNLVPGLNVDARLFLDCLGLVVIELTHAFRPF